MSVLETQQISAKASVRRRRKHGSRRGATLALMAVMLPVTLAIASYCINVVHIEFVRTELQITTDVATRAAGRVLAVTGDKTAAIAAGDTLLKENLVANQVVPASAVDLTFGVSTRTSENERYQFGPGTNVNAVKIESNGTFRVPMLFPTMDVPIDYRPMKTAISTQTELDIALVIDRSGSMAFAANEVASINNPVAAPPGWVYGDAVPPNSRWLDTCAAVEDFLSLLETSSHDERVSLTTYASTSKADEKLNNDYQFIRNHLFNYSQSFAGGATNIGDGILDGIKTLSDKKMARPWASRVMIILSDGIHNTGTDPMLAATNAASEDIMIFTVTFSDEADQTLMNNIAHEGAGKHYHAVSTAGLAQAFEDIARSLPTLITF